MSAEANTTIVHQAYAAFGRGDIPALLELLDDRVVWHGVQGAAPTVPTSGRRHGRAEVASFFQAVAANLKFDLFEPKQFVAQGDKVVALGHYTATAIPTGRRIDSDWAMVFTVREGRIVEFVEFTDSAAVNRAFEAAN